jgi:murein DD-endopeptidase MepM/ murein hydrolase activator NlpD
MGRHTIAGSQLRGCLSWIFSILLAGFSIFCFATAASAATQDPGRLPTRIWEIDHASTQGSLTSVLLPDWSQISFSRMPPILNNGSFDGKPYLQSVGYDLSRRWTAGMTPDQFLKLGDISEALQPEVFSLSAIEQFTGVNVEQVALSAFPLVGEQTIEHLVQIVPDLGQATVEQVAPIAALFVAKAADALGDEVDVAGLPIAQAIASYPPLGQLKLGEIDLDQFAISSIPNLTGVQLQQFSGWANSFLKDVPGLGQVPLARFPNPVAEVGSLVMRIDAIYSPAETKRTNTISGSDTQGFSVPCAEKDCAYIELDDLENTGRGARSQLEGKQWMSGKYQDVDGGRGVLKAVNRGREPTGRHPFGSAFKVVVMEPDETTDTVDTALFFRYCSETLGCTPYFIGPVPFFSYRINAPIFVGTPDMQRIGITPSRPTGAIRNGDPGPYGSTSSVNINCFTSGTEAKTSSGASEGMDLGTLANAIADIESQGSGGYMAVGTYTCADGGTNCGRGLGRYQFMNYNEYASSLIAARPGGQAFLSRVEQGYQPTQADLMQYFPPEDQDKALQSSLAALAQQASQETDPTTGQPFTGDRLIERVTQMHFGGPYSQIDGGSSDALGRLTLQDYGREALRRYKTGGGSSVVCAPATANTADANTPITSGDGRATGSLGHPAQGFPVTSEFGPRSSPCSGCSSNHRGIDIGTPEGTPVSAADGGQVVYAGWAEGYGNTVIIDHGGGKQTRYAHLSAMTVTAGTSVSQGQEIASSGSTGVGTGPHLHFEVREGATPGQPFSGTAVNPRQYINF